MEVGVRLWPTSGSINPFVSREGLHRAVAAGYCQMVRVLE